MNVVLKAPAWHLCTEAKCAAQIRGVIEATADMYGGLQGITGKALEEIEGMAPSMLEVQSGEDDYS